MAVLFPQANPVLAKIGLNLNLAGTGQLNPIIAGLASTFQLSLNTGEILDSWRIYSGDPDSPDFEKVFPVSTEGLPTSQVIIFGTDTDTGTPAVRNYLEIITDRGTTLRQFWVSDPPPSGGLYIQNQEAQVGDAFYQIGAGEPISFGINILPNVADEFFQLHEFTGNRWANTLRAWGGGLTGEVFLGGSEIISERYLGEIHGYYWGSPGAGTHTLTVRIRAAAGSSNFVDLTGNIRIEVS